MDVKVAVLAGLPRSDDSDYEEFDINNAENNQDIGNKPGQGLTFRQEQAQEYVQKGYSLRIQTKYDESLVQWKKALQIQESVNGRYHPDTFYVFNEIGYCYFWKSDFDKSLVAHRTGLRIERYLCDSIDSSKSEPKIESTWVKEILENEKKFTKEQIKEYDGKIRQSIQQEKMGDLNREQGKYTSAISYYQKAIGIEKSAFGSDNPTLAFLWRKIACLSGLKDEEGAQSDNKEEDKEYWKKADLIMTEFLDEFNHILYENFCKAIRTGDTFTSESKYEHAVEAYKRACTVGKEVAEEEERVALVSRVTEMKTLIEYQESKMRGMSEQKEELVTRVTDMSDVLEGHTEALKNLSEATLAQAIERNESHEKIVDVLDHVRDLNSSLGHHASALQALASTTETVHEADTKESSRKQKVLLACFNEISAILDKHSHGLQSLLEKTETDGEERSKLMENQQALVASVKELGGELEQHGSTLKDLSKVTEADRIERTKFDESQRKLLKCVKEMSQTIDSQGSVLRTLSEERLRVAAAMTQLEQNQLGTFAQVKKLGCTLDHHKSLLKDLSHLAKREANDKVQFKKQQQFMTEQVKEVINALNKQGSTLKAVSERQQKAETESKQDEILQTLLSRVDMMNETLEKQTEIHSEDRMTDLIRQELEKRELDEKAKKGEDEEAPAPSLADQSFLQLVNMFLVFVAITNGLLSKQSWIYESTLNFFSVPQGDASPKDFSQSWNEPLLFCLLGMLLATLPIFRNIAKDPSLILKWVNDRGVDWDDPRILLKQLCKNLDEMMVSARNLIRHQIASYGIVEHKEVSSNEDDTTLRPTNATTEELSDETIETLSEGWRQDFDRIRMKLRVVPNSLSKSCCERMLIGLESVLVVAEAFYHRMTEKWKSFRNTSHEQSEK